MEQVCCRQGRGEENGFLFHTCFIVPITAECGLRMHSGGGALSSPLKTQVCCY